jgi:uncharacterized protein YheU (UPF0270 family)
MRIPHTHLTPAALRAVVKEVVIRDGGDWSSIERRIDTILSKLIAGDVELHFHEETQACVVVSVPQIRSFSDNCLTKTSHRYG